MNYMNYPKVLYFPSWNILWDNINGTQADHIHYGDLSGALGSAGEDRPGCLGMPLWPGGFHKVTTTHVFTEFS